MYTANILNDYLSAHRGTSAYPVVPRIVCQDGFSLSVQASQGAYCAPRNNTGPWYQLEVGFPSAKPEFIFEYVEDDDRPMQTVYGYVPIDLIVNLINLHGGPV